jgi:hypothetical protein
MKHVVSNEHFDQVLCRKFTSERDEQISFILQIAVLQIRLDADLLDSVEILRYFLTVNVAWLIRTWVTLALALLPTYEDYFPYCL